MTTASQQWRTQRVNRTEWREVDQPTTAATTAPRVSTFAIKSAYSHGASLSSVSQH